MKAVNKTHLRRLEDSKRRENIEKYYKIANPSYPRAYELMHTRPYGGYKMKIQKLTDTAHLPTRGSREAAGWDLYADCADPVVINHNETVMIHTGIAAEIPRGCFGGVYARSGLSVKKGLRPANCTGVIDSDYRGEILVALHNDSDETMIVSHHDRIAQLIVQRYNIVDIQQVAHISNTERGSGGFGSSGK